MPASSLDDQSKVALFSQIKTGNMKWEFSTILNPFNWNHPSKTFFTFMTFLSLIINTHTDLRT